MFGKFSKAKFGNKTIMSAVSVFDGIVVTSKDGLFINDLKKQYIMTPPLGLIGKGLFIS